MQTIEAPTSMASPISPYSAMTLVYAHIVHTVSAFTPAANPVAAPPVHAKTVQQPSGFGRAGPHRIDDVARAITGEQRPRMGEQSAYRIEALVDPREERAVSLGPVFRDGGESGIRQHTQQAQCACAENLQHAPDAACAVMPIGARHKGDQQRHDGIDDDSGARLA